MIAIYEALGAERKKTHITYRYLVDGKSGFTRYKDEMEELLAAKNIETEKGK
jgi:hypothetical protein